MAVEGATDEPFAMRLLVGLGFEVSAVHGRHGKQHIDKHIGSYNAAAHFSCWLVLRDLDHDAACVGGLVENLLPTPAIGMRFRIVVRTIEAWLLADRMGVAKFFRVANHKIPNSPDELSVPKRSLVDLARHSTSRLVREAMIPVKGSTARVGPGYEGTIAEFAAHWSWESASVNSPSLRRCIAALATLADPSALAAPSKRRTRTK